MKFILPFVAAALLAACSFTNPPPRDLPSRSGLEPGEQITVSGNENVYAVARKYNVSMRDIIVLNDLKPPFALRSGQSLTLPARPGDMPKVEAAPMGVIESAPVTPLAATTSQNQSIDKGGMLLPPVTTNAGPPSLTPALPTPKPVETTVIPSKPDQIASIMPPPQLAQPEAKQAPVPEAAMAMVWPVQGPILSGFGPKGQGLSNDGINIAAPKGAPVVAAASGIVVYAGNEMKGFGNLVLIRHQGGWVTAYAHLDRVMVNRDTVVAQGDMIGTVGTTGGVPSPQLHFETRYEGKPVDPKTVIKG